MSPFVARHILTAELGVQTQTIAKWERAASVGPDTLRRAGSREAEAKEMAAPWSRTLDAQLATNIQQATRRPPGAA